MGESTIGPWRNGNSAVDICKAPLQYSVWAVYKSWKEGEDLSGENLSSLSLGSEVNI